MSAPPGTLYASGPVWWSSDDGLWSVIEAKDLPTACPRSKTRDTAIDAAGATWDASMTHRPGPGSLNKFVKIRTADFIGGPRPQITLSPSNYTNSARRRIPDFPGKCRACGMGILVLFTSTEHEGGDCPGRKLARAR